MKFEWYRGFKIQHTKDGFLVEAFKKTYKSIEEAREHIIKWYTRNQDPKRGRKR